MVEIKVVKERDMLLAFETIVIFFKHPLQYSYL